MAPPAQPAAPVTKIRLVSSIVIELMRPTVAFVWSRCLLYWQPLFWDKPQSSQRQIRLWQDLWSICYLHRERHQGSGCCRGVGRRCWKPVFSDHFGCTLLVHAVKAPWWVLQCANRFLGGWKGLVERIPADLWKAASNVSPSLGHLPLTNWLQSKAFAVMRRRSRSAAPIIRSNISSGCIVWRQRTFGFSPAIGSFCGRFATT